MEQFRQGHRGGGRNLDGGMNNINSRLIHAACRGLRPVASKRTKVGIGGGGDFVRLDAALSVDAGGTLLAILASKVRTKPGLGRRGDFVRLDAWAAQPKLEPAQSEPSTL
jgi:hypothetical protein